MAKHSGLARRTAIGRPVHHMGALDISFTADGQRGTASISPGWLFGNPKLS